MDVDITFRPSAEELKKVNRKLEKILQQQTEILARLDVLQITQDIQGEQMAFDMSRVEQEVAENTDAVDSATVLLDSLADELRAAAGDQAAVNAIADALSSNSDRLAAAVTRNTPSAPAPDPAPAPEEDV